MESLVDREGYATIGVVTQYNWPLSIAVGSMLVINSPNTFVLF